MPNDANDFELDVPGQWAKKYFLASRALMESVLRPYDLGTTQWYVLYRLSDEQSVGQSDLTRELEVERATLSAVIAALVRKGLIEQIAAPHDQRQKLLLITPLGRTLWASLPDPMALIAEVAFGGVDPADIATMNRVLSGATKRLTDYKKENRS
ncbi:MULTISPECIES: MarR family winged helix-turn-helix transcriptional regulator [Subtercola]|uniref:MarR family winged helix-turn-helix transcriptional regulator n=1 Tax=Subtercola TaxID=120212 RepID=UPI001F4765D0|nr:MULTISPECIES: MarR family transcriptional regulator [Subtercola]MEA9984321.1 MarR family transcriptional regulator [Subtercola sp. RTI3]